MPIKLKTPCRYGGCAALTDSTYCEQHNKEKTKAYEQTRKSSSARGYNSEWRKARLMFLKRHPLCAYCLSDGKATPATDVDHIDPHRGDRIKFWDKGNWQALCKQCHSRKTAKEDGGFGN